MPSIFEEFATAIRKEFSSILDLGLAERVRLPAAYIDGIEATQSIQYYKSDQHLNAAACERDNAVLLAAYKPAWVRAYVRSARVASVAVTGTLIVERRHHGILWNSVSTLAPRTPGTINAPPSIDYDTERSSTLNTINFVIPGADCHGNLRLTVRLTDASGNELHKSTVAVNATLHQTLRVRAIMVGYNGPSTSVMIPGNPSPPNLVLAAPTIANLQATAARSLLAMPVETTGNFAVAGTITFNRPLDDPRSGAGGCSPNWSTLLTQLATQRTNDGNRNDVVYYGLLAGGIPLNVPGCGVGGLGSGGVGDQTTFMHEIGHGYGFSHTPCGATGTPDPNYPNYSPHPSASIGEYGLDISNGAVFTPANAKDYMSYCFPQWMSLYQHARLVGHDRLNPRWLTDSPIWDRYVWKEYYIPDYIPDPPPEPWRVSLMRPDPVISIIGVVRSATDVEITSIARVRAVSTPPGRAVALRARLMDADGHELANAPLHELVFHGGCGCDGADRRDGEPPYTFQAMIPDVAPGAALTIGSVEKVIWERRAPSRPPTVWTVRAWTDEGTMRLAWEDDATGDSYEAWVQWSDRAGKIWHGLATGLTTREAEVSLGGLPAGDALIRVLVHDGFHTATSEPVRIDVPRRPPEVAIMSPEHAQILFARQPMRLWAAVTDSAGTPLGRDDSSRWLLDEREVGRGLDAWIPAPSAGEHQLTLIVRAQGDEARHTVMFSTIDSSRKGQGKPNDSSQG